MSDEWDAAIGRRLPPGLPRGVVVTDLFTASMAFAVLSAARLPLLPPSRARPLTTLQTSLNAADRTVASPKGLSTLGSDHGRFQPKPPVCYRAS